jgi:hypothetical protein
MFVGEAGAPAPGVGELIAPSMVTVIVFPLLKQ